MQIGSHQHASLSSALLQSTARTPQAPASRPSEEAGESAQARAVESGSKGQNINTRA